MSPGTTDLAGVATQMLRGEILLAHKYLPSIGRGGCSHTGGTYRIRIQITTSSDWATLNLKSGGTLANPKLVSASLE